MKFPYIVSAEAAVNFTPGRSNWKPLAFTHLIILFMTLIHILHILGMQILINKHAVGQPELDIT